MLVASTDGVGTKLVVARDTGRYDTVGIDLVAMCVDDLVCVGAEPLFLLDYIATGKVDPEHIATVVAGVHEGCRRAGCALIGGRRPSTPASWRRATSTWPVSPSVWSRRGTSWVPSASVPGTSWSACPPRGCVPTATPWPATSCSNGPGSRLGDPAWPGAGTGHTVADELLRPSVIYAPAVLSVRSAVGQALRACAHITGGGIVGNVPRALPAGLGAELDRSTWSEPRIFAEIARLGSVDTEEMDRVFNRGIGMALVVEPLRVDDVLDALVGFESARGAAVIGRVVEGAGVRFS